MRWSRLNSKPETKLCDSTLAPTMCRNGSCCVKPLAQNSFPIFCQQRDCVTRLYISVAILDLCTQPPCQSLARAQLRAARTATAAHKRPARDERPPYLLSPSWSRATLPCLRSGCNTSLSRSVATRTHTISSTRELAVYGGVFFFIFYFIVGSD